MTSQTHDATADSSRLGHFRSEQGRRQYEASSQRAMQLLPEPVETLDLTTGFGAPSAASAPSTRTTP